MKKIDRRLVYYFIGVALGCLLLIVLPRPVKINKNTNAPHKQPDDQTSKDLTDQPIDSEESVK